SLQYSYDFSSFFRIAYCSGFRKMYGRDNHDIACILKSLEDQVIGMSLKVDAHQALVVEGTTESADVKIESCLVLPLHASLYRPLLCAFLFLFTAQSHH